MRIIIGLGNPGAEYVGTRHNIGFAIVDKLKDELNSSEWEFNKKFDSEISEGFSVSSRANPPAGGEVEGSNPERILLVKPQKFMNLSGEAVRAILDFYKLTPSGIIVIHDDLDIEIGHYKISRDVSSAGHNGVEDIIEKIGTQDFTRVRIGVEMTAGRANRQIPGDLPSETLVKGGDFVLQKFTEDERKKIYPALLQIVETEIPKLISEAK